ncbi:hypothetical protein DOTSEDRAFT_29003 [Dothistroma septosporum NZE10]|uniref:Major facilitator superfamily (MFS) profile domain-containing protein n=1 Tax=Dothistroma septosporum (strain NZE10 / CBS 128990) TaxID=675120 RepID=M2XH65_DOTSN|nr:hypothetical protein DOTSEDRAFT_29003 [Dothistroma septosporum NZE10]
MAEKIDHTPAVAVPTLVLSSDLDPKELAAVTVINDTLDPIEGQSEEERIRLDKRLVWKCDRWLIPWLSLIYLLCFLDRTNIGNARLAGLEDDLDMKGHDYNIALTIFFISYGLSEPFTNLILKKVTPRVFFTLVVLIWGLCMICTGLVHNYAGLLAARWFLGITEAGLFPGVQYYLSCWYKRSELGLRLAIFFANTALAGSFGGLLAAAIANMDGLGGKAGWAWIFVMEGLATILVGALSCWLPDTASFLTEEERLRVQHRLAKDNLLQCGKDYDKRHVTEALKDWKCWAYGVTEAGSFMVIYAFSLFLPTILSGMGYTGTHAQLLTVPPYAVAAVMTVVVNWVADRTQQRRICNMVIVLFAIVGFGLLLGCDNAHVQYAGTFLGAMGIYPTVPNTLSWAANNVEGPYRRGVLLGIKPRYKTGHSAVLAYLILFQFGGTLFIRTMLARENKERRNGKRDHLLTAKSEEEIVVAGDKRPDFMYTL